MATVNVRSLRAVFAPVGAIRQVTKQEAVALIALGNAEAVADGAVKPGEYTRRDMQAEETHGHSRKGRSQNR